MDIKELNQVSIENERKHWWICTRFNYIDKALELLKKDKVTAAEFGCGSCQNLWYLKNKKEVSKVIGIDPELPEGFSFDGLSSEDVLSRDLNYNFSEPDLLLGMDVLEHIEDDKAALTEWTSKLSDNSLMLITVPAFQSLWSGHDVFLDHKRRYTKSQLVALGESCGLRPVFSSYAFGALFPVVWLIRKILSSDEPKASDLNLPPAFINLPLRLLGWIESKLGGSPLFGTSVICIFKKA